MFSAGAPAISQELDYSRAIQLDAEALAEQGMAEGYANLQSALRTYGVVPLVLSEKLEPEKGIYTVTAGGHTQRIFPSPLGGGEYESWGVATAAFFEIVNRQLVNASVRFYALNSGNDLMGIFLTESQAAMARKSLKRRSDWPYLPTMQAPWFGQYH
jgi:hypothetical protein